MSESDVTSDNKTKKLFIPTHSKNYSNHGFQNEDGEDINLGEYIKAFEDETKDTTFESETQDEEKSDSVYSNIFVTPQKDNVLSPPVVMRRVSENETPKSKPLVPSTLFQSTNDSEYLESIGNNFAGYALHGKNTNIHGEDEDQDETSSMISQYGSEVGEMKMRMDDIHTMDAVHEGANDDDSECEDNGNDEKVSVSENIEKLHKEENLSTGGSVESIDLSNHLESDIKGKMINRQQNQARVNTPVSPSAKSLDVTSSKHDTTPTTPIGAVSIALRNIGKGMSNMARAGSKISSPLTSSSPQVATVSPKRDERYLLNDVKSNSHWLSPRFGNQRSSIHSTSTRIHQPQLTSSQSTNVKSGSTQFFGITQCLSFDPESGKLPYSNMRMTDSPPSSPLPHRAHRKTRSWGQGSSDFLSKGATGSFDLGLESSRGRGHIPAIPLTPTPRENMIASTHMSPRRLNDNEREDAKILLKIFVEQTLMYDSRLSKEVEKGCQNPADGYSPPNKVTKSMLDGALQQLRSMSKTYQEENSRIPHHILLAVLDELEASYEYAKEMKQAALSASSWLNSNDTSDFETTVENSSIPQNVTIDQLKSLNESLQRQLSVQYDVNEKLKEDLSFCRAEIGRLKSPMNYNAVDVFPTVNKSVLDEEDDDSNPSSNADEFPNAFNALPLDSVPFEAVDAKKEILLLKAELEETNKLLKQMEIDLKKSSSRYQQKTKYISGQSDQIQKINDLTYENDQGGTDQAVVPLEQHDQRKDDNDDSHTEDDINTSALKTNLKTELDEYVSAIQESDKMKIKELEEYIRHLENEVIPSHIEQKSECPNGTKTLGWKVLKNLAPPPDHDLRSPIVSAILSEWNPDKQTQSLLLEWIENIMTCHQISDAPPLHISGLNDQLQDGFLMHIIPFLSKRSDADVEVSTRVRFELFHDILINVKGAGVLEKEGSNSKDRVVVKTNVPLTKSTQMMAFKASAVSLDDSFESKASSNVSSRLNFGSVHFGEMIKKGKLSPEPKTPSSLEVKHITSEFSEKTKTPTPHNAGLVAGALNVMGGLLTRRKAVNLNDTDGSSDSNTIISPSHLIDPDVKDTLKAGAFTISDSAEDNEPYHRVVSAPPGRIGITFVQYRGHAMVSDVYQDSPLVGWIFPSDIVIAIDEIPVSGMRVPEIVKLLTIRKDRQRALRVISSHAMTDLIVTEKSGAFIDG